VCIPSNGCYHFVVGQQTNGYRPSNQPTTLSVSYGGTVLKVIEQLSFASVSLRNSESPPGLCRNVTCNKGGEWSYSGQESELEIFLFYGDRTHVSYDYEVQNETFPPWHSTNLATGSYKSKDLDSEDRLLVYHRECFAGCAVVGVTNWWALAGRVQANGIIYGAVAPKSIAAFSETIQVGNCLPMDECRGSLVQVDIDLSDQLPSSTVLAYPHTFTHFYAMGSSTAQGDLSTLTYINGEHTRHVLCLPDDFDQTGDVGCWALEIDSRIPFVQMRRLSELALSSDLDRVDCTVPSREHKTLCSRTDYSLVIPLSDGCEKSKSKRALTVNVIWSSVVATFLLIALGTYAYVRRRRRNSTTHNYYESYMAREVVAIPIAMNFACIQTMETSSHEENPQVDGANAINIPTVNKHQPPQIVEIDADREAFA